MIVSCLVGIGVVLSYMDKEWVIMVIVSWLLILIVGYQCGKVCFNCCIVQFFKFGDIVKIDVYWVRCGVVLMQNFQVELVWLLVMV